MSVLVGVVLLLIVVALLFILMTIPTRIKRQDEEAKSRTIHRASFHLNPDPNWVPFRPPALTAVPTAHLGSPSSHSAVQRPLFLSQRRQVPPRPAVVDGGLAIHPLRALPEARWRRRPGHKSLPDRSRKQEAKCQAARQRSLELGHARCVNRS